MKGSIRQRGPNRWEIRVGAGKDPVTGQYRTVREMLNGTKAAAETRRRQLVKEVEAGKRQPVGPRTVGDALDIWLADLERLELAPYTIHSYRQRAERDVRPALGRKALDTLTTRDLQVFYGQLARKGLGSRSVRYCHVIVSQALAEAIRAGWIAVNVAREARIKGGAAARKKAVEPAVVERLISAAAETDPVLGLVVRLAAVGAMRRGELCALRRCDVVLSDERSWVTVDGALSSVPGYGTIRKGTKTGKVRHTPLDATTAELLAGHLETQAKRAADHGMALADDAWLFAPDVEGRQPLLPDTLTHRFRDLCQAEGVEGVTLQTLRSWCSSAVVDSGFDDSVAAARLGHASTYTTRGHYIRPFSESEEAAADAVAARLG